MKILIAYFSAGGTTAKLAGELAAVTGADLFEIRPEKPYSADDLKWTRLLARCNREKFGRKDVPVAGSIGNFEQYDAVWIGFPIWYGGAPNVVNTFCKRYDWSGKKVCIFATSGGSGIGKTAEKLMPYVKGATVADARVIHAADEVKSWAEG